MSNFKQIVKSFILENELIGRGETVVAGVSGGADSVCLFHLLRELRDELSFDMCVVHINHMIRDSAAEDAEFVRGLCEEYDIDFYLKNIDIPALVEKSGRSEEEVGRDARYKAFEEIAEHIGIGHIEMKNAPSIVIATAHNQNDQAETMLHNLFRGSRLTGLAGIKPKRARGEFMLIRPILILERTEIEEYLNENGYTWRTDETNLKDDYTRNRIRHHILPYAEQEINTGAIKHTAEAAEYLGELDDYLERQTELAEQRILINVKLSSSEQKAYSYSKEPEYTETDQLAEADPSTEENTSAKVIPKTGEESCRSLSYDLVEYRKEPTLIRKRLLMRGLKKLLPGIKDVTATHLDDLDRMCLQRKGSASINLPYRIKAVRSYDKLTISLTYNSKETGSSNFIDRKEFESDKTQKENPSNIIDKSEDELYNTHNDPASYTIDRDALERGEIVSVDVPNLGSVVLSLTSYDPKGKIPDGEYTKWLDYDKIKHSMQFRKRCKGDLIQVGNGTKSLKKFMIDEKIPSDDRNNMFILMDGDAVVWLPFYRIGSSYKVDSTTERILEVTLDRR